MMMRVFYFLLALIMVSPGHAATIQPIETELSEVELALVKQIDTWQDKLVADLRTHVEMNTGTDNIEGLDRYRRLLEKELQGLGFTTRAESSAPIPVLSCEGGEMAVADHLIASIKGKSAKRILLNGHMDTVFSADDEFQTLQILDDGTLKGPGVADMKGGIVAMLYALRALKEQGLLSSANFTVLLNSDEEIGSLGSRPLIERLAKEHDLGFVFEGSYDNKVTRARKGLGQTRLRVLGRESHAGGAHQEGVSANLELAHKIIDIEALTDYERGVTVNTGVMAGGEKRNTVAGCADAYIDMRFPTLDDGEQLAAAIKSITERATTNNARYPELPKIDVWTVLHRPAKPQNAAVDMLIAEAMGLSKLIGEPIVGTRYSGGGTDGSIAQSVGLPTIDSVGIDGGGAHSSREYASVQSLIARAKLAAVMLARQIDQ